MDLDIGHIPPMMPMVNGAYAKVEVSENDIFISYIFAPLHKFPKVDIL